MTKATHLTSRQPSVLLLFVVIGLVPLITGFWILTTSVRETHRQLLGQHLGQMADYAQLAVQAHLAETVRTVDTLTVSPVIIDLVVRENQRRLTPQEILATEVDWPTLDIQTSDFLQSLFFSPTSTFLRNYRDMNTSFREIIVTDNQGRVVAATNKTSDYDQTDERWWQHAFREGTGGSYVGDIVYDESAEVYAVEVAQPIMRDGVAVGVLKVSVESTEVFSLVNSVALGQTGYASLIRNDGTILISPKATIADDLHYPHNTVVNEGLLRGR